MMNKRIQKLFNEAGFHQPEMERLGIEDKFEKFAKLIVRECAERLLNDAKLTDIQTTRCVASIREHFGVE